MHTAVPANYESRSSLLWWAAVGTAAIVVCRSLFELSQLPASKLVILAVGSMTALLIAQFRLHVSHTDSTFYPKTVFSFWGIAWLGLFGGILLALAASAADAKTEKGTRSSKVWLVARDIVSSFASALAFHYSLALLDGSHNTVLAGSFSIPNEVIFASCAMAAAHFAAMTLIDLLDAKLSGKPVNKETLGRVASTPLAGHLTSLAVAIILFLVFNHFGIEFGLVLLPIAIAANAAYRIHIRSLEQKTREIREASRIHLATVEALATAIDARDQVGIGHVRRTQIYAVGLGRLLNLSEAELDALRTGALLHDIGKLAVPDHILNKPGRLTHAEMEKTKIHSSVGASILEKVGFATPVVPTVKYHHEFWNGSGYPEGLRGTQIPLTARVLAVADAFDTLRGARPYRPAVSREEACNFLRAGSGSQFDPNVVDLLIRNLKAFEDEIAAEGLGYESGFASLGIDFVEQIKNANREAFTLYSLAREFSAASTLEDTLKLLTEKIGEFVPYEACAIYLADDAANRASAVHVAGRDGAYFSGRRVQIGEGATGRAIANNEPVENADPAEDIQGISDMPAFLTMVSRPLFADGKAIGAISIYSARFAAYQDEHLRLLETVSKIAADAIAKCLQHAETATHALTDPITGLPNARCLQAEFEKEVKRTTRTDSQFQLLMLDLDGFKSVNDSFGHKAGDRLLTALGGVIRGQLRDYDFLARYAGDEFVALIPNTDSESVSELCKRIGAAVCEFGLPVSEVETARVGVSIGAASYPTDGETFDQLIIAADKAMYADKASHKQKAVTAPEPIDMSDPPTAEEYVPRDAEPLGARVVGFERSEHVSGEIVIVELDETHVISTSSIN